jgi:hypothetical protein
MKRTVTFGTGLAASALLLLGTGSVHAQADTAKCSAAQMKCATTKATALLGCHNKAEGKGDPVDAECITKAEDKFTTLPEKGCMEKAESKPPCFLTGGAEALEAKIDAFVNDIVTDLDPGYPTPVENKCSAGKKKCVANKVKALLGCSSKDVTKPDPAKFSECVDKATAKFDESDKGCFAKLEAKQDPEKPSSVCITTGDTADIEAKVDAFVADVVSDVVPPPPPPPSSLLFSLGAPGGPCGTVKDGGGTVIKNLTCGGLNLGAGGSLVSEGPTPDGSLSLFGLNCSGTMCTILPNSTQPAVNTATPDCTDTGCNFGTPLPIPNSLLPTFSTCVLNTWASPASGTINLTTGASTTNVPLTSDVYLTGNLAQPCPLCSAIGTPTNPGHGLCDRGPRTGMACTTTSSTGATRDCPTGGSDATHPCTPGGGLCVDGSHVGVISVNLSPLTTGSASDTDPGGLFCPAQTHPGCFGSPECRTITEVGVAPVPPIAVGVPTAATLVSVFCVEATANGTVNTSADLPGPGAVSLPGTFLVN